MLTIVDSMNEFTENFKAWMIEHGDNPLLWICLFFAGVLVFFATYRALHKEG